MVPLELPRQYSMNLFNVNMHMVNLARKFRREQGIFPNILKPKRIGISPETIEAVLKFYDSPEITCYTSCVKDYISDAM